jgi:tRNA (cytosine34-C5)-methyltransferase
MFLTRCKDISKKNSLYYTSETVRDIVHSNGDRVKIINTGVKAFSKCENKGATCDFRLAQEGSLMTIPFMAKRIVRPTKKDLEVLLVSSDVERPPEHNQLDDDTKKQIENLDTGSVALVYEEKKNDYTIKLEFVGWKGKNSLRAYVPKNERVHYMRLIGCDTSKYEKNKFEERRANNATNNEQEDEGNGGAAKQEILD